MFKIFYNNKILLISENETDDKSFTKINFLREQDIEKELNIFLNFPDSPSLNIYGKNFDFIPEFLSEYFKIIYAAGGLVFNVANNLLYIKRLGYFDFPKGKLEKGETSNVGAVREVCEECGILEKDLQIEQKLMNVYHIYPLKGRFVLKETSWFLMRFLGDYKLQPQIEENITEVGWMEKSEITKFKENTYPSLLDLLNLL